MADSVGSMSVYGASDELTDPLCDPCFKDGTIRPVAGYCPKCVEFYCQTCLAVHRRMAVSERHKILLGSDMPACQADKPVKYQLCDKHDGEGKDRYCFDHGITICGICDFREHKQCQVKEVSDACKSFNISAEKASFSADVGLLLKHVKETSQSIKLNKAELEKKKQDILTDAQKQIDELLKKVHQSYQDFSEEVTGLFKDHTTALSWHQSALEKIETKVDAVLQSLQQRSPNKQNDQKDFQELHYSSETVRFCEDKIKLLNLKHIDINGTFNASIQPLTLTKNQFSNFSLQTTTLKYSTELPIIHYPYTGSCQNSHNTVPGSDKMGGHTVQSVVLTPLDKINVKIFNDRESCLIWGVDITVDGNMLIVDYVNCKIKLFSPYGTLLSFLKPPEKPVDVAVINKSEAAISMENKQIGILDIADNNLLSMARIIKLDRYVYGITNYNKNLIIICFESNKSPCSVQMIDINGEILWTTTADSKGETLFEWASFLTTCSGDDGDTVLITDWGKQAIILLDAGTGKVVNVCDVTGKEPSGVTVDDNGNVFVCYESGEITAWSRGMREETRLTTESKYLKFSLAWAYNNRALELVVTSRVKHADYCNSIHRYKISVV